MNRVLALIITLGVLIVLAFSCLFVVDQRQYAVVFALGEIKRVINEPGLYMKLPSPLQDVRYFDKRTLTYDSDEIDRFITAEKINIQVDSFVKWRIADPRQFFVSVGHSPLAADDRIGRQLRSALNNEIARLSVADVISSARETLVKQVMKVMSVELEKIGVTIVDVRLKRVDFAPEVAERVYERMRSERTRVANERRAKGAAEGERIRADADRQREVLIAKAYRDAQNERGAGDAEASRLYAKAFGRNPEFASFYRSLEAYRASFADRSDMLVLDPQSDFFRYFQGAEPAPAASGRQPPPPPATRAVFFWIHGPAFTVPMDDPAVSPWLLALGLVLLLEGLMPLLLPGGWRNAVQQMAALRDGQLRFVGLMLVLAGLLFVSLA